MKDLAKMAVEIGIAFGICAAIKLYGDKQYNKGYDECEGEWESALKKEFLKAVE